MWIIRVNLWVKIDPWRDQPSLHKTSVKWYRLNARLKNGFPTRSSPSFSPFEVYPDWGQPRLTGSSVKWPIDNKLYRKMHLKTKDRINPILTGLFWTRFLFGGGFNLTPPKISETDCPINTKFRKGVHWSINDALCFLLNNTKFYMQIMAILMSKVR